MSWRIQLFTDSDEASIREVFEFVEDDCNLTITCDGADPPPPRRRRR
uniref:Uncharacterized protein n=1 Tax=Phenylobacterium glaciei TaxID=2803784 RepID=A0A974S909_9CAUL|nr:hypothetical protein JKL49_06850 [Phenylobacterium glaciei]